MILEVAAIARTMLSIGSDLPAYKELLDQVLAAFHAEPAKQQELKDAYAKAMVDAKAAHDAAQAL